MREFKQTHLSKKQIYDIWTEIYKDNKEFTSALETAQLNDAKAKGAFSDLAKVFHNSSSMKVLGEKDATIEHEDTKYLYWDAAMEMAGEYAPAKSAEEAFNKYLIKHNITLYDTYDPTASPLNSVIGDRGEVVIKGNSRAARNNMLIDLMRQRLMDKETLKARYTPGGFENNRDAALRMRVLQYGQLEVKVDGETIKIVDNSGKINWKDVDKYITKIKEGKLKDPEPEYDPSDPTAILVYNQQNQVAAKLIGIFANQNTNHVYASTMHKLQLKEPLYFGNHVNEGLYDMLTAPEDIDVDTNVSEYLAASVDAVKDPVLNFLNLNLTTADAGALLARIGYTPQEIGLLFNQPIIREVCDYAANNNVSTDVAIVQVLKQYGGSDATFKDFIFDANTVTSDNLANNIVQHRNTLEKGNKVSTAFKQNQLQVLWLFNELMADSSDLNSFVQCTRFTAANSIGSTWGDFFAQEERVKQFIDKYTRNDEESDRESNSIEENKLRDKEKKRLVFELFDPETPINYITTSDNKTNEVTQGVLNIDEKLIDMTPEEYMTKMSSNPFAFEQCMMDLTRKAARKIFKRHFPYFNNLYVNMRNIMSNLTKYGRLGADNINSLHREFMVYLLSKQEGSAFNGESWSKFRTNDGTPVTNRDYYTKHFPVLLNILKTEKVLQNYPFFDALVINGDMNSSQPLTITVHGMGGLQSNISNMITDTWAETFKSEDVIHSKVCNRDFSVKDLAMDFYFYNFYHLGYNFHPTASINLAPTLLKLALRISSSQGEESYIDFIRRLINPQNEDKKVTLDAAGYMSFAKQYMLNHLDDKTFVYYPTGVASEYLLKSPVGPWDSTGKYWRNSFTVSYGDMDETIRSLFTINNKNLRGKKLRAFRPIIAIEKDNVTAYYIANSNSDAGFNISSSVDGSMEYRRVHPQGAKGQSLQYFDTSAYNAFQKESGTLEEYNKQRQQPTPNSGLNIDTDGSPQASEEGSYINPELNKDIFTDDEWQQMFNLFKQDYSELFEMDIYKNMSLNSFKNMLSNTSVSQNRSIINNLATRIGKGEKMKTIDKDGNSIDVCS